MRQPAARQPAVQGGTVCSLLHSVCISVSLSVCSSISALPVSRPRTLHFSLPLCMSLVSLFFSLSEVVVDHRHGARSQSIRPHQFGHPKLLPAPLPASFHTRSTSPQDKSANPSEEELGSVRASRSGGQDGAASCPEADRFVPRRAYPRPLLTQSVVWRCSRDNARVEDGLGGVFLLTLCRGTQRLPHLLWE